VVGQARGARVLGERQVVHHRLVGRGRGGERGRAAAERTDQLGHRAEVDAAQVVLHRGQRAQARQHARGVDRDPVGVRAHQDQLAEAPDSSTARGNTSTNARTIAIATPAPGGRGEPLRDVAARPEAVRASA
jgi:hypothetical protein